MTSEVQILYTLMINKTYLYVEIIPHRLPWKCLRWGVYYLPRVRLRWRVGGVGG